MITAITAAVMGIGAVVVPRGLIIGWTAALPWVRGWLLFAAGVIASCTLRLRVMGRGFWMVTVTGGLMATRLWLVARGLRVVAWWLRMTLRLWMGLHTFMTRMRLTFLRATLIVFLLHHLHYFLLWPTLLIPFLPSFWIFWTWCLPLSSEIVVTVSSSSVMIEVIVVAVAQTVCIATDLD